MLESIELQQVLDIYYKITVITVSVSNDDFIEGTMEENERFKERTSLVCQRSQ